MKPILLLMSVALLAACSGKNEANERNFKKAIESYNEHYPICLQVSPNIDYQVGFPIYFGDEKIVLNRIDADGKKVNDIALKQMKILTSEGVYKQQKDEEKPNLKNPNKPSKLAVYTLTKKGKEYIKTEPATRLCMGKRKIVSINWYSIPSTDNGLMVSKVSYRIQYKWDKWAEKLIKVGRDEWKSSFKEGRNAMTTLVLTNQGWLDARELNNQIKE